MALGHGNQSTQRSLYHPTSYSQETIRLLTLLPSPITSSPLRCHLNHASLQEESSPKFEALSYVWGPPEFTQPVKINGHEYRVTKSLEDALRRLRRRWQSRVIWVDQICINQDDLEERNRHVLLMNKVYSKAERVVAWLGNPPSREAEDVMDWTRHWLVGLQNGRSFLSLYMTSPQWSLRAIRRKAVYLLTRNIPMDQLRLYVTSREYNTLRRIQMALGEFDESTYWSRMWILQEFVLAYNNPMLLLGKLRLKDDFLQGAVWARSSEGILGATSKILQRSYKEENLDRFDMFDALEARKEAEKIAEIAPLAGEFGLTKHLKMRGLRQDENWTMSSLMKDTYQLHSGDPRDKVYALYSMVQSRYQLPQPDYGVSADMVLRDVVSCIITVDESPRLYDWLAPSSPEHPYPSWTPDFTTMEECSKHATYNLIRVAAFAPNGAKTSGDEVIKLPHVDDTHEVLTIQGWRLDEVSSVFDLPETHGIQQITDTAWHCALAAGDIATKRCTGTMNAKSPACLAKNPSKLGDFLRDLKYTVQILDPNRELNLPHAQDRTGEQGVNPVYTLMAECLLSRDLDERLQHEVRSLMSRASDLEDSVLFCTIDGFVGFVYKKHKVRKSDVVAVLSGCDFPYVLRPMNQGWTMVGSAYVSGITSGEFVDFLKEQGQLGTIEAFDIV